MKSENERSADGEELKRPIVPYDEALLDFEYEVPRSKQTLRFRTTRDVLEWCAAEREFWKPLCENQDLPSRNYSGNNVCNPSSLLDALSRAVGEHRDHWQGIINKSDELIQRLAASPADESARTQLGAQYKEVDKRLDRLKGNLRSQIGDHLNHARKTFLRSEPEAQFVISLAQTNPLAAYHAFQQLCPTSDSTRNESAETCGRIQAVLFQLNPEYNPGVSDSAFHAMVESWTKELAHYKDQYESLREKFDEIQRQNGQHSDQWNDRTLSMEQSFKDQLESNSADLNNLQKVYEIHMALAAPRKFWSVKERQHELQIKILRQWVLWSSVGGILAIGAAAWLLFPEWLPSDSIPWRNLGLFALLSTFIIWPVRLLVKLLLSNIHLKADASERVVMIQTFMSLMRNKDTRDKLEQQDIALVLAPLFKPSTSGVIKDDGSPSTLFDILSRFGK